MPNLSRPLHRILVVAVCLMFAGALAISVSVAAAQGDLAQGRAGAPQFVCNQVTALTLTREWYQAGFEQAPGIADDRWQLKARQSGYITEWSNPNSDFWNQPPQSPCANGSVSPDHVVLTVLSWRPACCATQAEWETQVGKAVATLRSKYAGLKRIDLMTVVRGPRNQGCPAPPAADEYIAMPQEFDAALAGVAAKFPGLVFVGPKVEAPSCASFVGGGPHLTKEGNAEVAKAIAAYFVNHQ
jgi:hypothetical protein